jgi:hypothetical protein
MHCQDCKAICADDPPKNAFKPSFASLKLSAGAGCKCCTFLKYCIESHTDFDKFKLAALETAPVMLTWFKFFVEGNYCEEGGASLWIESLSPDVGAHDTFGRSLEVDLEFYTLRGTFDCTNS